MNQIEVMKQALMFCEMVCGCVPKDGLVITSANKTSALLRQAIEQAEKVEPVASIRCWTKAGEGHSELVDWLDGVEALPDGEHKLYTHPTAPATGLFVDLIQQHEGLAEELAAPAQPLTNEVISDMMEIADAKWADADVDFNWARYFARAIEAHIKGVSL